MSKKSEETAKSTRLLVVDNDHAHAETVADVLDVEDFVCTTVNSGEKAVELLEKELFDVVITDLKMGDIGGIEVLEKAKAVQPAVEVILMTGHGSVENAVEAMRGGAFNYLLKPLKFDELRIIARKAAENSAMRGAFFAMRERLDERFGFEGVIGNSTAMRNLIERTKRIAPTDATVLILGETGTGKELIAQAIHQNSLRKERPFVALNCAALSENILESELFGHIRGAFTDATADRIGKFEYADGGTMFLDEVGDMPMPTQIKLLRVLESGEITRVGSNDPIKVNVRLLSATNRSLEESVERGEFRADLFHRLKVVSLRLPTLRERRSDILVLIDHFQKQFSKQHSKVVKGISPAARRRLYDYDWPGNVRQLRNFIESMVVVDFDELLDLDDLPEELVLPEDAELLQATNTGGGTGDRADDSVAPSDSLTSLVGHTLAEIEEMFIRETLEFVQGNRDQAAKMLGMGERTLYRKIKK